MKKFAPLLALVLTSAAPAPVFPSWGFDLTAMNAAIKPGDDFFTYANGAWVARTPIPADKKSYSLRGGMSDRTEGQLHELLEAAATSGATAVSTPAKAGAFYASFMDEARIEALGATPLKPQLDAIRAATTRSQIAALMGRNNRDFEGSLFALLLDVDLKDPAHYAIYAGQGGLGLPDRDYYLDAKFAGPRAQYQAYAAKLLKGLGWPDADANAAAIVAFETRVAAASWTKTEQRDPDKIYNPMTPAELAAFGPGFDWGAWLTGAGLGDAKRIIIAEKSAVPKLAQLMAETPLPVLQAWLAFTTADNAAPYLSHEFADAVFEMREKTLGGQPEQKPRWKRGVYAVSGGDYGLDRYGTFGNMGWAVGDMYTAKYFPPASKAAVEALVVNIKSAFRTRLQKLDWMGPATRAEAIRKLDTYIVKVGYPDSPRDYTKLVVRADDLVGNVQRAGDADWGFFVARSHGPVDKREWGMTPQTNDAYNGSLRDIVFPAAILQAPMFDAAANPAVNYGAIGGVIGHEISHGFDDQGRKIDADGKLRDWWTPADAAAFEKRAAMLGKQYDAYAPLPGFHVNGGLTMGENIADLGGLTVALDAYRASLNGKPAPVIGGLTGEQRVYLGWAQAWRGKTRDDALKAQLVSNPHSPPNFRVNGPVRNIDSWYQAFGIKPGDALYVAPADRVRLW